jgi:uncharacterized phage-associated protein
MATVDDVAAFLLQRCGTMTTFKLHKLLYYAQGWSLAWDRKPLFDAKFKAYENGPVVPMLFNDHRGARHVSRWPQGDPERLTDEEQDTVRAIVERYGKKTPEELVAMTHEEPPWKDAWGGDATTAHEIKLDAMRAFFTELAKQRPAPTPAAHALADRLRASLADDT